MSVLAMLSKGKEKEVEIMEDEKLIRWNISQETVISDLFDKFVEKQ